MEEKHYPAILLPRAEKTVKVEGEVDFKKPSGLAFKDGSGYLNTRDNLVYIFGSNGRPRDFLLQPCFWYNENDELQTSKPMPDILKNFKGDNIQFISIYDIIKETEEKEELMTTEQMNDINQSKKRFVPTIYDDDDFLKKLIKTVIAQKDIIIAKLKSQTTKSWQISNMVTGVGNKTKMTPTTFNKWVELLGINFSMRIEDDGSDSFNPLNTSLIYRSLENDIIGNEDISGQLKIMSASELKKLYDITAILTKNLGDLSSIIGNRDNKIANILSGVYLDNKKDVETLHELIRKELQNEEDDTEEK